MTDAKELWELGQLKGALDERQRIIKLLEDEELQNDLNNPIKDYDQLVWLGIKEQLIALIEGEQDA